MNSVVVGLGCLPTVEGIVVPARALHLILISQSSHLFVYSSTKTLYHQKELVHLFFSIPASA